jgi:hypothetical protein
MVRSQRKSNPRGTNQKSTQQPRRPSAVGASQNSKASGFSPDSRYSFYSGVLIRVPLNRQYVPGMNPGGHPPRHLDPFVCLAARFMTKYF